MKIRKLTKKEFIMIAIFGVVILTVVFLIYSHNKKQQALYEKYMETASQNFSDEDITGMIANFTEAIKIHPNESRAYGGRAFAYYANEQDEEALRDIEKALSFQDDNTALLLHLRGNIFKEQDKVELAVEAYGMAYSLLPSDRDYVHDYVSSLVVQGQYDKAYPIIKKYFDDTPKDDYWDDADVWLDMAITSAQTHRCLEAGAGAWHALMRTKEGEDTYKIAEVIMSNVLNAKDCIDTGDTKEITTESMKDAIAKNEALNMK